MKRQNKGKEQKVECKLHIVENYSAKVEQEIESEKFKLANEKTPYRIMDQGMLMEIELCQINDDDDKDDVSGYDRGVAVIFGIKPSDGQSWYDGYLIRFRNMVWHRSTIPEVGQLLAAMKEKYKTAELQPA